MVGRTMTNTALLERLDAGPVICAEGYLFELERRGYLQAGGYVPEVVLDHPEKVSELHREFVHAGSDVVEAFTYYAHREKLRLIGKEHLLEEINRQALEVAAEVARETGALLAGDVCNTNVYTGEESAHTVRAMFDEQVGWAAEAGVDFVIGETLSWLGEAVAATEAIKAAGLPAVITLAVHRHPQTREGHSPAEACRRLEAAGADVVGLNCSRGPATMLPLLAEIRAAVACPVAALPVPYRTHPAEPSFQSLSEPAGAPQPPGGKPFPTALDPFTCTRYEIADFARAAFELGVRYLGVCCGAAPHHIRAMAEALGRAPAAGRYSADMSKHAYFGTDASLKSEYREYAGEL
jgi:betaine-homocysteine S-methyltransferase